MRGGVIVAAVSLVGACAPSNHFPLHDAAYYSVNVQAAKDTAMECAKITLSSAGYATQSDLEQCNMAKFAYRNQLEYEKGRKEEVEGLARLRKELAKPTGLEFRK